jgi:hypothetical protein
VYITKPFVLLILFEKRKIRDYCKGVIVMKITRLHNNQIFVFGSNRAGRHGKGAALYARQHFGAVYGVGVGPTGRCYAIPTKDADLATLPLWLIRDYVKQFVAYARLHPELEFLMTPIGTGLAGYTVEQLESILPDDMPDNIRMIWKERND